MQPTAILLPPAEVLEVLLALSLCALLLIRALVASLAMKGKPVWSKGRIALEAFFCGTAILVVCFLAADSMQMHTSQFDRSEMILVSLVAAVGVLFFAAIAFFAQFSSAFITGKSAVALKLVHFVLLAGAASYFAARTQLYSPDEADLPEVYRESGNLVREHSEYLAITDAGAQVALYDIDLRDRSLATKNNLVQEVNTPVGAKVIPRADANINANCHGWVFTGGKHLLRGHGVDQILQDNGYSIQGVPVAGDVIVYRSTDGDVLHTGIVSGILLDGTCIIESKWGIAGRYLHQAEDQPYGLNYAFYRSERSGHLVTVIKRSDLASHLANFDSVNSEVPAKTELQVAPQSESESQANPAD